MNLTTGKFENPRAHHEGWFRVFRFSHAREVWFGRRWVMFQW